MNKTAKRIEAAMRIGEKVKAAGFTRKEFSVVLNVPGDRVYKVLGGFTTGNPQELKRWEEEADALNEENILAAGCKELYIGARHDANKVGEVQDTTPTPELLRKPGTEIMRVWYPGSGLVIGTVFPGKGAYRWQFRQAGKIKNSGPCTSYEDGLQKVRNEHYYSLM